MANDETLIRGDACRFVKGFVGRFEPGTAVGTLSARAVTPFHGIDRFDQRSLGLLTFGSAASLPWLDVATGSIRGYVKGRPHTVHRIEGEPGTVSLIHVEQHLRATDGKFACLLALDELTFVLAVDSLGLAALYVTRVENALLFATHLGPLLESLPSGTSFDPEGVASSFSSWMFPSGRTPFSGVRRLGPGEMLVVRVANRALDVESRRYRNMPLRGDADSRAPELDLEVAAERLDEIVMRTVSRESLAGPVAIPLSGGLDSMALATTLVRLGVSDLTAFTFGPLEHPEMRAAARLALELGIPHEFVPYDEWDFATYAPLAVGMNGGVTGLHSTHVLPVFDYVRDRTGCAVIGLLGDAITGKHLTVGEGAYPVDETTTVDFETVLRMIFHRVCGPHLWMLAHYETEIVTLLAELREVFEKVQATEPLESVHQCAMEIDLTVRQATCISSTFDLADVFVDVVMPFCSLELARFFASLPFEFSRGQILYRHWIGRSLKAVGLDDIASDVGFPGHLSIVPTRTRAPIVDWQKRTARAEAWLARVVHDFASPSHERETRRIVDVCRKSLARFRFTNEAGDVLRGVPMLLASRMGDFERWMK